MRNFQGMVFIRTHTCREIFKSALVYLSAYCLFQTLLNKEILRPISTSFATMSTLYNQIVSINRMACKFSQLELKDTNY